GHGHRGRSGAWLRKGLITVQFVVAITLIIGTAVVYRQLGYIQQKDLGFRGEQVITVPIPSQSTEELQREVLAQPDVVTASITDAVPGHFQTRIMQSAGNLSSGAKADTSKDIQLYPGVVDCQYDETLGLPMAAGRFFTKEHSSAQQRAHILNETAAEAFGWTPQEAISKAIDLSDGGEVIGVLNDLHIASLRKPLEPVIISLNEFE